MLIGEWNETLLTWFFSRRPLERAYLRIDDGELDRLNAEQALRLDSPADDLIAAIREEVQGAPSLRWLRRQGDEWRSRSDPDEAPPWLAVLALSVLVVARETERGSLAFYPPFSEALGLTTALTQVDYEESLYKWWVDLAKWLTDINEGKRGLPSWRRIPHPGPRCVIGHPYTQVLLRREDSRDIDTFLRSLGQVGHGDLEVTDPATAGADLLRRLRQWAAQRRVSGRLWDILHGTRREASDSLQYMLLDRLLDEIDATGARSPEREARLAVTLDDWTDRRLRFSAIAPASVVSWEHQTLDFDGQTVGPLEEGEPYPTPIPVDAIALNDGVSVLAGSDVTLVYRPSDVVALAARDWSMWCSVDDAEAGETVYLLVADTAAIRLRRLLDSFGLASIDGVPEGWKLYGPSPLASGDNLDALGLPIRKPWQAVPRLVGGLEVARRSFLLGGPPAVIVPSGDTEMPLRLDGDPLDAALGDALTIDLTSLNLGTGHHKIDVGPYRLTFELHTFDELPIVAESVGRTRLGAFAPVDGGDGEPVFIGAARRPTAAYDPAVLAPIGARMVVLGLPGHAAECSAHMGAWAVDAGLPQLVFEPAQGSSYSGGRRPIHPIRWMAVQEHPASAWSVTQVQRTTEPGQEAEETAASSLARDVVSEIGTAPMVLRDGHPDDSVAAGQEWAEYARSVKAAP